MYKIKILLLAEQWCKTTFEKGVLSTDVTSIWGFHSFDFISVVQFWNFIASVFSAVLKYEQDQENQDNTKLRVGKDYITQKTSHYKIVTIFKAIEFVV